MSSKYPLEINGVAPDLSGQICKALICEAYFFRGANCASANTTFLLFNDVWYRLYFDCGVIFWRQQEEPPHPWSVPEEGWNYPHQDIAKLAGVSGKRLQSYKMRATDQGSLVEFCFEDSVAVILEDANDRTDFRVVRAENANQAI